MIAIAINGRFQQEVEVVCQRCSGEVRKSAIKSFGRMARKCVSKDDHYFAQYPRPSLNIDVNRNCATFDEPEDLVDFINQMKGHASFDEHPVRIKNMFLFDDQRAEAQYFYRCVMINWLYTPGITFKQLAESAKDVWDYYHDFAYVHGLGGKDSAEAWCAWRAQIETARAYLTNPAIEDYLVQSIVETQCLLRPYLEGRTKMHLLYQILRATDPQALWNEFRREPFYEEKSYPSVQLKALERADEFIAKTSDINHHFMENKGATALWQAAADGHVKAVQALLKHPDIEPNETRLISNTTPLFIAAHGGHFDVVEALVKHPRIKVNLGAVDTGITPLFIAVQEGQERVVEILLCQKNIIIVDEQGVMAATPLCKARILGHEHIEKLLLAAIDPEFQQHRLETAKEDECRKENRSRVLRLEL
jgi:hypothetical protein